MAEIYIAVSPTGRIYVGKTCKPGTCSKSPTERRADEHAYESKRVGDGDPGQCQILNRSLRKHGHGYQVLPGLLEQYGLERAVRMAEESGDHMFVAIEECAREDAMDREAFWIERMRSCSGDGEGGMNATRGGEGSLGRAVSQRTREKISLAHKGRPSPFKGMKFPERSGELSPRYGKRHTAESREKMSRTRKERGVAAGKRNPMYGIRLTGAAAPGYKGCDKAIMREIGGLDDRDLAAVNCNEVARRAGCSKTSVLAVYHSLCRERGVDPLGPSGRVRTKATEWLDDHGSRNTRANDVAKACGIAWDVASDVLREWMGRNGLTPAPRKAELVYSWCQAHRDAVAETSDYAIAREAGVSVPCAKENVDRWCSENGVSRTRKEVPKERKDDVYAWLDAHPGEASSIGHSALAKAVGCPRDTAERWLERWCSENGVERVRKETGARFKKEVYAWLDARPGEAPTASPARIAREVGCARSTACRWLKRYRFEKDGAGR